MGGSAAMIYIDPNLLGIMNTLAILLAEITTLVVGYLLVRLGFELIRDGAKGDFQFTGDLRGIKLGLASVSPGTLFALLGAVVIVVTLIQHRSANTAQATQGAQELGGRQQDQIGTASPIQRLPRTPPMLDSGPELSETPPVLMEEHDDQN